jgi:hypothetical protein
MRRYLIPTPAIALGLLVTGMAAPAAADNPTPVSQCPGGVCVAAESPGEPGGTIAGTSGGGGGPQAVACTDRPLSGFEAADLELVSPHTGQRGGWYFHSCQASGGGFLQQGPVWLPFQPSATVQRPVIVPGALAQQAYRLLPIPTPELGVNPPADQPQLVNLPTWLFVSQATWGVRTASVSVPGESVTATATPVQVAWVMGDGSTVICNGPGTAYDPNRPPASQHSTCTYTYQRSSAGEPDQQFAVSATATWRVTWQATGLLPASGQLPPLQRTAQLALRVAEAQTLN